MSETLHSKIYKDLYFKIKSGYYKTGDILPTELELCGIYRASRTTVRSALEKLKNNRLISRVKKRGSTVLPLSNEKYFLNKVDLIVACIMPFYDNYNTNILDGIKFYAQTKNCQVVFYDSHFSLVQEREILQSLLEHKVAGVIAIPCSPFANIDVFMQFGIKKIPLVFIDHSVVGSDAPCVSTNNFKAAYELVDYLITRNHNNIAFYQFCTDMFSSETERFRGYCKALCDHNIVFSENNFLYGQKNNLLSKNIGISKQNFLSEEEKAMRAVKYLCSLENKPSAVFCSNDSSATSLIDACKKLGIGVPEQLSVVGFDNTNLSQIYGLTTVSQNWEELARYAFEILYSLIMCKPIPVVRKVDAYLVERRSVIPREKQKDY